MKNTYQFIAVLVKGNEWEVLQQSFFASAEKAEKEFKRLYKHAWTDYDVRSFEVKPDEYSWLAC
jgi:hypothetical protein